MINLVVVRIELRFGGWEQSFCCDVCGRIRWSRKFQSGRLPRGHWGRWGWKLMGREPRACLRTLCEELSAHAVGRGPSRRCAACRGRWWTLNSGPSSRGRGNPTLRWQSILSCMESWKAMRPGLTSLLAGGWDVFWTRAIQEGSRSSRNLFDCARPRFRLSRHADDFQYTDGQRRHSHAFLHAGNATLRREADNGRLHRRLKIESGRSGGVSAFAASFQYGVSQSVR